MEYTGAKIIVKKNALYFVDSTRPLRNPNEVIEQSEYIINRGDTLSDWIAIFSNILVDEGYKIEDVARAFISGSQRLTPEEK